MFITNPRSERFAWLQSYITSDVVQPAIPKMIQTHSDRVVIVISPTQEIWEADGMVTRLKNTELHVRVADCGNIYAYDPIAHVIGVCHTGRQGTHKNIIHNMIDTMMSLWSIPHDIRVWTGPCISWKNYQFWPEVRELFDEQYYEYIRWKYYLNLPLLHHDQLLSSWILSEHIIQSDICTFETLTLPSYRREGADSGRITWSIMMIE